MSPVHAATISASSPSGDIVFACPHCASSFVVDAAAAGVTLSCQKCGKPTTVPNPALDVAAGNAIKISDLQHQLKENESQRTEITGYINQLSIQLHRWQLRLQTLKERQEKAASRTRGPLRERTLVQCIRRETGGAARCEAGAVTPAGARLTKVRLCRGHRPAYYKSARPAISLNSSDTVH